MSSMLHRGMLAAFVGLIWTLGSVQAAWVAYNDCLRENGDNTADHVTGWTIHDSDTSHTSGLLRDFKTGSTTGMPTVTFRMGPAGLAVSYGGSGGNPVPGTDAYELFHDIIDFGPNLVYYGQSGWWVEIRFSGLHPDRTYSFVGTAIRSNDYPERISLLTILDAQSYVNHSSPGVVALEPQTTELLAGNNATTGYVVRWDEIVPSAEGSFTIRAEAAPGSDQGLAYPLGGFRLQEDETAVAAPLEVDAGEYEALIWPTRMLTLHPTVEDPVSGNLSDPAFQWSQLSGPAPVTFTPDAGQAEPVVTFPAPGSYELSLQVWDGLGRSSQTAVTITVLESFLGDFNEDHRVNGLDLVIFFAQWLDGPDSPANLNAEDCVNAVDFALLANHWGAGQTPGIVINEILARNDQTNPDLQGQYDDWIELYHAGDSTMDVGGLFLTDDEDRPTLWQIPTDRPESTLMAPGDTLLIWADGDVNAPGLHAPFELDAERGESLWLYAADGSTLLDTVTFGPQVPDVSWGRTSDGVDEWTTLHPTPAASNAGAYLGVVGDTHFSHDRGFYQEPFSVTITTDTPGAVIFFTLDGSTPTPQHGYVYTEPIPIGTTTCLRAMAAKDNFRSSNVDTQSYLFVEDIVHQATNPVTGRQVVPSGWPASWGSIPGDYQMDPDVIGQEGQDRFDGRYSREIAAALQAVPTLSLVMNVDDWCGSKGIYTHQNQDGTERVCSFEFFDPCDGMNVQGNCALAMQGGVSGGGTSLDRWKTPKLSLRPRFKVQTDDGKLTDGPTTLDAALFPDSPVKTLNTVVIDAVLNHAWLHPSQSQRVTAKYIQDQYVADLHNALGGYSPHGRYVHLYLNGLYWGLYYLHERPDHAWAASMFGGDKEDYDAIKHNSSSVINNAPGGSATANYNAMLTAVNAVANHPTDLTTYHALSKVLDIDEFITYVLVNWTTGNHDWPFKNWYATHRRGGVWRFHSWDAEHTLEGTNEFGQSPSDIHNKLARSPEYRLRFADHIQQAFFHGGPLSAAEMARLYQKRMDQVRLALVAESARWGDHYQSLPYTQQDWLNTQQQLLDSFFPQRPAYVLTYLRNLSLWPDLAAPVFQIQGQEQYGGTVDNGAGLTITGMGSLYYSLDGSDPRLPGGAVNPQATRVTGVVTLPHSVTVKARAYANQTWSPLSEALFAVGPVKESLRISEIMYHPSNGDAEYLEVQNVGAEKINLNQVHFTDGITFTFDAVDLDPGQVTLIVSDANAFAFAYGSGLPVAGIYTGKLSNSGERITLVDALDQTIQSFSYDDDWYKTTDGDGYSLVAVDPAHTDPNDMSRRDAWMPSPTQGGSPGLP